MMVHSSANVIQATTTSTTRRLGTKDQKKAAKRDEREKKQAIKIKKGELKKKN